MIIVVDMCMDKQNRLWVSTMAGPAVIAIDASKKVEIFTLADHMNVSVENPINSRLYGASDGYVGLLLRTLFTGLTRRK